MTFQSNQKFADSVEGVKKLGIHVNENKLQSLYNNLSLYQSDRDNPEYPTYLVIRELGGRAWEPTGGSGEPLSNDIATIVLEDYFREGGDQNISFIVNQIRRISKNNFNCKILDETKYDEDSGETNVTIRLLVKGEEITLIHEDESEDGSLQQGFLMDILMPALAGAVTKGHLLYYCEHSIVLIYFDNENNYNDFIKTFSYYKEI